MGREIMEHCLSCILEIASSFGVQTLKIQKDGMANFHDDGDVPLCMVGL